MKLTKKLTKKISSNSIKHTKHSRNAGNTTNKTLKNVKNISILSYNISWESMSGAKKDWTLCSNNTNPKHPKHSSVCVSNIAQVINNNETDFISLQEATDYHKLITECPRLSKMGYKMHKSGLDVVITFWNKNYKLVKTIEGEFEKGRPWLATIFSNGLCFINVHFGHYYSNEELIKLNNIIQNINSRISLDKNKIQGDSNLKYKSNSKNNSKNNNMITRFIIAGDFNYDIKDFGDKKGQIILDGIRFYHHPKHILTCCVSRRRHYDHVIDSKNAPIDITIPNVEFMASDHKPIIATLSK